MIRVNVDTRQKLIDAATEVFLEKGYEGARVAEIARRAGLTTGAIYGNFESKANLLTAALVAAVDGALNSAEPEIARLVEASKPHGVPPDTLRTALELMTIGAIASHALGRDVAAVQNVADVMRVAATVVGANQSP
ncbi:MAG: hypothetical protein QOF21_2683 [Actinomycetota bacterium]|jgi:AcrR family transcriptional regulator